MSDLSARLSGLDEYIAGEMDKWHVPGLAAAVIHDGEIIHQAGYGTRDLDHNQPVTPETLFAIGSCTKAFTAMGLALLVEDGLLDWDKPVRHYMPQFRLYDAFATEQMTARDLVCHRSGLPRHDAMWYGSTRSRWELFAGLQYLQPSAAFRYVYQYQNLMYMAAGCLIEAISGQTWEAFTQERIFDVLGMKNSLFSVNDADKAANAAKPHEIKDGAAKRVPFRNIDAIGPAGSIHSNLPETATWLRMHMQGGQYAGRAFVAEDQLRQMHQPHVGMPPQPNTSFVEIQHNTYGLGWAQQLYRGRVRVRHTGGIDGFITDVSFMPQENLGVIVFNNGGDALSHSVAMYIYDCLLGLEPIDWRTRLKEIEDKARAQVTEDTAKLRAARKADTALSHPPGAYVGDYTHPGYGTLTVTKNGEGLQAVYNSTVLRLVHFHYDVFETEHDLGDTHPPMPLAFRLDLHGNIRAAAIQLEPAVDEIVFARQ